MSYGQAPFMTSYTNNTIPLINVGSEDTADETDLITFIKGTAGNGKKLYVDTNLRYNPLNNNLISALLQTNRITISDTGGSSPAINVVATNANGEITFTNYDYPFPAVIGSVGISAFGTVSTRGQFNGLTLYDRSTGDYFQLYSQNGVFYLLANGATVAFFNTSGLFSTRGNSSGIQLYERTGGTPVNYWKIYDANSTNNLTFEYNGNPIATVNTTGITTLVPQTIQTTNVGAGGTLYFTLVQNNTTSSTGQILYTPSTISYNSTSQTLTVPNINGYASSALTISTTTASAGTYYLTMSVSSLGGLTRTIYVDSGLSYNQNTGVLTVPNVSGTASSSSTITTNTATSGAYFLAYTNSSTGLTGRALYTSTPAYNVSTLTLSSPNFSGRINITSRTDNYEFYIPIMLGNTGNQYLYGDGASIPLTYNPANNQLTGNYFHCENISSGSVDIRDVFTSTNYFSIQHTSGILQFNNFWSSLAIPVEIDGNGAGLSAYNIKGTVYPNTSAIELDSPVFSEIPHNNGILYTPTSSGSYASFGTITNPTSTTSGALITLQVQACNPNNRIILVSVPLNIYGSFGAPSGASATTAINLTALTITMTRNGTNFTQFAYDKPTLPLSYQYTGTSGFLFFNGVQQPFFQLNFYFCPTDSTINMTPSTDTYVIKVVPTFTTTPIVGTFNFTGGYGGAGFSLNLGTVHTNITGLSYDTADPTCTALAITKNQSVIETVCKSYYVNPEYVGLTYTKTFTTSSGSFEPLAFCGGFVFYDITFIFTTAPTAYSTLTFNLANNIGNSSATGYLGRTSQLGSAYVSTVWATTTATICYLNGEDYTVVKFSLSYPNSARRTLINATNNGSTAVGVNTANIPIISTGQHNVSTAYNSFAWALSSGTASGNIYVCGRNT